MKRLWAQFPANLRNSTQPGLKETLLRAPAGQAQETLARSQSEITRESISGGPAPTGEQGAQSAICSDQVLMHCCSCAPASEDIPEKISGASATAASLQRTRINEKFVPQRFKLEWQSNFPAVLAKRFLHRRPFGAPGVFGAFFGTFFVAVFASRCL